MKRRISLFIAVILLFNFRFTLPILGAEDSINYETNNNVEDISEYCNPDYEEYLNSIKDLPEEEYKERLLLAPSEYSYNEEYVSDTAMYTDRASSYSSTYDSISGMSINFENIFDYTNSSQIGWSFAACDALEIYLRKKCYVSKEDCNFSAIRLMEQISSTVVPQNYAMRDGVYSTGNFSMASAYWMRGEYSLKNENIHVTDTVSLSDLSRWSSEEQSEERIDSIKKMVMDYGGVFAQCELYTGAFDQYYSSYNNNEGGEIQTGRSLDGGIVIVGWDDNYSIDKFGASKPSEPGAFKAITNMKVEPNSGTLHLGAFYISYNMVKIFTDVSAIKKAVVGSYAKHIYEYDKKAHSGISNSSTTTNVYANKYVSTGDAEKVKSITTYCEVPNSYFNVYISKDGSMSNLQEVNIQGASSNGYKVSNMGYVTMTLSDELIVDSDFTVAIQVETPMTSAKSIPQEIMPVENTSISGRCFVANNISSMQNGNYTDCGSRNNIIKVHVEGTDRQWKFDDNEFDQVKNSTAEDKNIKGLNINGNIGFYNSNKRIKGTTFYNYALMTKTNDYKNKSLSFYVNGSSKIYVIGKSNSENITRRIAVYSDNTKETGYINISSPNGYSYSYDGEAGYIYLYSVDDNIRIYSVAVEGYDEDDWYPLDDGDQKEWDFSDLYTNVTSTTGLARITENIECNGMYLYADTNNYMIAIHNESTSGNGYRYHYGLDLEGSGSDSYRTIAFDVNPESDLYITARTSGSASGELYLTNRYGCDLDTDINKESLTISSDIVTYKVHYNGYGERVYLRSKDNGIRIINIVVDSFNEYGADEHSLDPSNIDDLTIGSTITNKTIDDYNILGIEGKPAQITASTEAGYTKAIRLMSAEYFERCGRISFNIGDSSGTNNSNPARKIRVKAKSTANGALLILADKYGYVIGSKALSTNLNEYVFDYSGDKSKLYLFTYNRGSQSFTDIYNISKTDINYYTEDKTITLSMDDNDQGNCILSVNNIPDLSRYTFKILYDKTELSYAGFDTTEKLNNAAIVSDSAYVSNNTYGQSYVSIRFSDADKTNWSGILGTVKFDFVGDTVESEVKLVAEKTR